MPWTENLPLMSKYSILFPYSKIQFASLVVMGSAEKPNEMVLNSTSGKKTKITHLRKDQPQDILLHNHYESIKSYIQLSLLVLSSAYLIVMQ